MTGIGTVKEDDPQLNVRGIEIPRQPRRTVIDSRLEISPDACVLAGGGTWIVAAHPDPVREARLRDRGTEIIMLPNAHGKVDLPALMQELGQRQISRIARPATGAKTGVPCRQYAKTGRQRAASVQFGRWRALGAEGIQ